MYRVEHLPARAVLTCCSSASAMEPHPRAQTLVTCLPPAPLLPSPPPVPALQEAGMKAVLRPGPYICAEWDFGGFPYWFASSKVRRGLPGCAGCIRPAASASGHEHAASQLTSPSPGAHRLAPAAMPACLHLQVAGGRSMRLRTSDPAYLAHVDRWWAVLFAKLRPLLHENGGGPIVMVQVGRDWGWVAWWLAGRQCVQRDCLARWPLPLTPGYATTPAPSCPLLHSACPPGPSCRPPPFCPLASPVIAQIENEYGFCGEDKDYLRHLIATARAHLSPDVLLFTTDPPNVAPKGSIAGEEVYTVVDFGPGAGRVGGWVGGWACW